MSEQATFKQGAFAMIFDKSGRILLVHRTDKDIWNLPGGRVDTGESPWEACIREVKEETGLDAVVKKCVGIYYKQEQDEVVFQFICEVVGGEITESIESDQIAYFSIDTIPVNMNPRQLERIQRYIEDRNTVQLVDQTGRKTSAQLLQELGIT